VRLTRLDGHDVGTESTSTHRRRLDIRPGRVCQDGVMRLLMIAPPGAGKGTQAARIAKHFGIENIASGNLFREEVRAGTEVGRKAKDYLDKGDLVPDELVLAMLSDRLKRVKGGREGGFVLDGFPRTVKQAEAAQRLFAESGEPVDAVIYLEVSREESVRRMLSRGGQGGRTDDQEQTIRHRLDVFDTMTKPLLNFYATRGLLLRIDGEQPIEIVTEEILTQLAPKT
jgi:adenylate kinase